MLSDGDSEFDAVYEPNTDEEMRSRFEHEQWCESVGGTLFIDPPRRCVAGWMVVRAYAEAKQRRRELAMGMRRGAQTLPAEVES